MLWFEFVVVLCSCHSRITHEADFNRASLVAALDVITTEQLAARTEQLAALNEIKAEQRETREQLATQRLETTITPSQASSNGKETYERLLEDMGLVVYQDKDVQTQSAGDTRGNFTFSWPEAPVSVDEVDHVGDDHLEDALDDAPEPHHPTTRLEVISYKPLCEYLRDTLKKNAFVIAHGYNVGSSHGLLFDRRAHGMRPVAPNTRGQVVSSSIRVKGRSDLAVIDDSERIDQVIGVDTDFRPVKHLRRNRVRWVIEVKDTDLSEAASREAVTQLIGLNIANAYTSPKVLLTNLRRSHHVYYIKYDDSFPWYSIHWTRCGSILAAVQFIEGLEAVPVSLYAPHFGRPDC